MSDRKATSELSSSVREGVGYDEIYPSEHEPKEYFLWSLEREPSTHSFSDEEEEEDEGDEYGEGDEDEEDEEDEEDKGNQFEGIQLVGQEDGGACPFILLSIWTISDFYPTMSDKVFNTLRDRYQIPENIPLRLPRKFEKCYSGKTVDVGMYDAMFPAWLRLPLMDLHRQLANYLGLAIGQNAPNAWRIFIGAKVIWGQLSDGNRRLTLDKFFYCYKPQHISSS